VHEIVCPHCAKAFTVDEAGYAEIVRQVRTEEFDNELHERLALAAAEKDRAFELAEARARRLPRPRTPRSTISRPS